MGKGTEVLKMRVINSFTYQMRTSLKRKYAHLVYVQIYYDSMIVQKYLKDLTNMRTVARNDWCGNCSPSLGFTGRKFLHEDRITGLGKPKMAKGKK
jgi:hypothetical protein